MADHQTPATIQPSETTTTTTNKPSFGIFPPDFKFQFPDFSKLHFPGLTTKVEAECPTLSDVEKKRKEVGEKDGGGVVQTKDFVRVSDGSKKSLPSLKLEVDESEQGVAPKNMWQVYALGGFLIARWMWAKYKESQANKSEASEDEETPPTDQQ